MTSVVGDGMIAVGADLMPFFLGTTGLGALVLIMLGASFLFVLYKLLFKRG